MKLKTTITNAIVYSTYNDDNNISFDLYYDFETVHNELGIGIKLSNLRAEGILEEMVMPVMEFVIDEYVETSRTKIEDIDLSEFEIIIQEYRDGLEVGFNFETVEIKLEENQIYLY